MAALKFTIQYNRDMHQAKITIVNSLVDHSVIHHVDHVICNVSTWAEFANTAPRFVMAGVCQDYILDKSTGTLTIIIV